MEAGAPTNVRHVAHVTFDRFDGFRGLPVEYESEVSRKPPSASTSVFGVSMESMQLSFDSRGNSVPTILLMMQKRLYAEGGLQTEGIFRIAAENSQDEYVREQLNGGVIPDGIDVHCLAGLIKAWFRELPTGVLDHLSPEQVMQSRSEEECTQLIRQLPPTEFALIDWAINLMADVAELEYLNKMDARNVALVFAPNMTRMSDPLTALKYAVQVMNFLKTLIVKTIQERKDFKGESSPSLEPFAESGNQSSSESCPEVPICNNESAYEEPDFIAEETSCSHDLSCPSQEDSKIEDCLLHSPRTSVEDIRPGRYESCNDNQPKTGKARSTIESSYSFLKKGPKRANEQQVQATEFGEKSTVNRAANSIYSRYEGTEAWR